MSVDNSTRTRVHKNMAQKRKSKISKRGRLSVWEDTELREMYIKIYHLYFAQHWTWWEIAEYLDISKSIVYKAIRWVSQNFLKIPSRELLNGAIFAIKERLKKNTELYEKERKKGTPSIRSIVELNREIREDSKILYQLEQVYQENYGKVDVSLSADSILKLITKEAQKKKEKEIDNPTKEPDE